MQRMFINKFIKPLHYHYLKAWQHACFIYSEVTVRYSVVRVFQDDLIKRLP
jgi:hypothetical protein